VLFAPPGFDFQLGDEGRITSLAGPVDNEVEKGSR
jgi:hypothetical protein